MSRVSTPNTILVFLLTNLLFDCSQGLRTAAAFIVGALLSASAGWYGMRVATDGNVRTTVACAESDLNAGLTVAFTTGACMGFTVVSLGLAGVSLTFLVMGYDYADANAMQVLAGFGFGASSIALFARVAGGIYTKAADVGADLVGKVEAGIDEDDPHNPAVIADNVGDNVGDVAGMSSDLFGSFAESTCAALVITLLRVMGVDKCCFLGSLQVFFSFIRPCQSTIIPLCIFSLTSPSIQLLPHR